MKEIIDRMKQDARKVNPLARRIKEYEELASAETANTYRLEKVLSAIRKLTNEMSPSDSRQHVLDWCARQDKRIQELKDEFRYRLGNDVKAALAPHGLSLEGQLPVLHASFYTLKVNFETGTAAIFWGPEAETIRARVPLSPKDIERTIVGVHRRLVSAQFLPEEYLRLLYRANVRYLEAAGQVGERVLLIDLLKEMAILSQAKKFAVNPVRENFTDYSRIQFSYHLYRLKQSGVQTINDFRLHLSVANFDATTDRARSLWVPDNDAGTGTYYSYLSFVKDPDD